MEFNLIAFIRRLNMRLKLPYILSQLVYCVLILSCGDKDHGEPANSFSFYDQNYPIKNGIVDIDSDGCPSNNISQGPIYFHKVYLLTEGLSISKSDTTGTGTGSMMSLTLTSATREIDVGTYSYNWGTYFIAGNWMGRLLVDLDRTRALGEIYILFRGTVTVARNGDVYTIDLDSPEYQNVPKITAHFRGTLSPLQ